MTVRSEVSVVVGVWRRKGVVVGPVHTNEWPAGKTLPDIVLGVTTIR